MVGGMVSMGVMGGMGSMGGMGGMGDGDGSGMGMSAGGMGGGMDEGMVGGGDGSGMGMSAGGMGGGNGRGVGMDVGMVGGGGSGMVVGSGKNVRVPRTAMSPPPLILPSCGPAEAPGHAVFACADMWGMSAGVMGGSMNMGGSIGVGMGVGMVGGMGGVMDGGMGGSMGGGMHGDATYDDESHLQILDTDDDESHLESLENPLRPASLSAPRPSHNAKIRVRKDVKNPGSKPRRGTVPVLEYGWKISQHTDMTEEQCEDIEQQIAVIQCGQNLRFKPFKRPLKYRPRQDGSEVATLSCAFDVECGCPWKCRRIRRLTSQGYLYAIEFSDVQHVDHNIRKQSCNAQRKHLSKGIKKLIDSPTKLGTKPRQLVAALRQKVDLTADDVPAIVRERARLLR